METKHTPGPWVLHPTALHPAVRSVGTMNGNPVDKENARLIAAAPELLAALQQTVAWMEGERTAIDALANARAIIAKATTPNE